MLTTPQRRSVEVEGTALAPSGSHADRYDESQPYGHRPKAKRARTSPSRSSRRGNRSRRRSAEQRPSTARKWRALDNPYWTIWPALTDDTRRGSRQRRPPPTPMTVARGRHQERGKQTRAARPRSAVPRGARKAASTGLEPAACLDDANRAGGPGPGRTDRARGRRIRRRVQGPVRRPAAPPRRLCRPTASSRHPFQRF